MSDAFYFGEVEDGPLMQGDIFPSIPFPILKLSRCSVGRFRNEGPGARSFILSTRL